MRVAMIGLRAPGAEGGIEEALTQLTPRLVKRGCRVTVYCRGRYNQLGETFGGAQLVDVPALYTKHLETLSYSSLSALRALSKGHDLVHFHAVGPALISFVPRLAAVPVVTTVHGLDWKRAKWGWAARAVLRTGAEATRIFPHAVITVSRQTTRWFEGRGNVVNIPNGVSPIPYAPMEIDGLQKGYLLYLGRIVPEKSLETIIEAHSRSTTSRQLVITGGAHHSERYLAELKRLAGPGVVFTGARFGETKAALLHHAGAVLSPSRLEGLPLAILEAMVCARVVLASDIDPHRELLGDTGVLIRNEVTEWVSAFDALDRGAFATLGPSAKRRALDRYGWEEVADRTLDVYRQAVAANTPRRRSLATARSHRVF